MKTILQKLERWAKDQPSDRQFNFMHVEDCLLCNFYREAMGMEVRAGGQYVHARDSAKRIWSFDIPLAARIANACTNIRLLDNVSTEFNEDGTRKE